MVLVGSDRFRPLAERIAASLGADWLPEVLVSHPIGGIDERQLEQRCETAWEGLDALLGDGR